ncbi:MAG: hypothetical protein WAM30_19210 [Candidatus Dormiibacterota bacterium]
MASGPGLAAAVREQVPREVALVRWTRPDDLGTSWARTAPWPWIVVGSGPPPPDLAAHCGRAPVVVAWLGAPADSLPTGAFPFAGWSALARWLGRLRQISAAGLRLTPYRGILTPDGARRSAPVAEGLLAAHPRGLPDSALLRREFGRLQRWGVACRPSSEGELLRLAIGTRRRGRDAEGGTR